MLSITHAHVTILQADNLLIKGKNGTNNAFVVIELGKEIYRTSVKENSGRSVVWNEECELKIPKIGNKASIVLTAQHRNSFGLDQFLGMVKIPLDSFDKTEKRVKWFKLDGKPGKNKDDDKTRGKLEVQIGFLSKGGGQSISLTSLPSKKKTVIEKLTGSLYGLTHIDQKKNKTMGVSKIGRSLQKMAFKKKQKPVVEEEEEDEEEGEDEFVDGINDSTLCGSCPPTRKANTANNLDPGVISEDEEEDEENSQKSFDDGCWVKNGKVVSCSPKTTQKLYKQNPQISISFCDDDSNNSNNNNKNSNKKNKSKMNQSASVCDIRTESLKNTLSSQKRKKSPKLGELNGGGLRLSARRLSASCVDFHDFSTPVLEKKFTSLYLDANLQVDNGSNKKKSKLVKKLKQFRSFDYYSKESKEVRRTVIGCEAGDKMEEMTSSPSPSPSPSSSFYSNKSEFKNKTKDELIKMILDLQKKVNCMTMRVKELENYLDGILSKVMETVPKLLEKQ